MMTAKPSISINLEGSRVVFRNMKAFFKTHYQGLTAARRGGLSPWCGVGHLELSDPLLAPKWYSAICRPENGRTVPGPAEINGEIHIVYDGLIAVEERLIP
jgi:hypothetical protein